MKLQTILLAIVFGLFATTLHASSESDQQGQETKKQEISKPAYLVGGIVGTFTIFPGMGHAIQGRWSSGGGWIHTVAQTGLVVGVLALSAVSVLDFENERKRRTADGTWHGGFSLAPLVILGLGSLAYIPLKIFEIISVWHIDTNKYKLVDKKSQAMIVSPVLSDKGIGMMIAMPIP